MFSLRGENTSYEGDVPSNLGIGSGDYIDFDLDLETGQIVGWTPKTVECLAYDGDEYL
jgi:hypothetical protein